MKKPSAWTEIGGRASYNLAAAYQCLNHLDDAEAGLQGGAGGSQAGSGSDTLLRNRYRLAFRRATQTQMARLAAGATGKPGKEDALLAAQADTEAWSGRLRKARELTQRAISSTERNDDKETAATYQAVAALREVAAGNRQQARTGAQAALKMTQNRNVKRWQP